jgi:hypothetical protein
MAGEVAVSRTRLEAKRAELAELIVRIENTWQQAKGKIELIDELLSDSAPDSGQGMGG